ncbi:MAG: heavy-metal-associated domain-containing protein [Gammaproteobacteria bacterium]|nr:heavy-metal-associated domain-containing protein [Gammaproteobacteria bacterium]MDH5778444.1 heavy-metal-associated domain-containing protein [Gammaproteobacteria bacterium]
MQNELFKVMNVKCGGCANNIQTGLKEISGVTAVAVDIESGQVTVEGEVLQRDTLADKLAKLGYPETNS